MSKFNLFLKSNTKITSDNIKLLYNELILMRNPSFIEKYDEQCREVIQYIIEYLIYGDKNDSTIFDIFCEYNFMNEFILLANLQNRSMNLQIIKSFSVLILNLTNTTTLYYIFSNNFINQIISNDYEKYDDEFLSYYVNFIKSLSLKIDKTTIQFFFQRQLNSFPLLQSALKIYNHTDPMIKNVVRNIILTILKIKYDPITDYFSTLPSITYFPFLSCRLRDLIIKLNEEILSDDQISLKNIHDDIVDDILYLQDIFSLKIEKINFILINCLFYYMILPQLCGSLISMTKPQIAISVSLYILLSLIHYIKDECFLNLIFTVLFSDNLNKKLFLYMENYPNNTKNYFFDWNSQKKSNSSTFTSYISTNFSEPFIKSLVNKNNSPYSEVQAIIKKYDKFMEDNNSLNYFKNLLEEVLSKFSNTEFDIMTTYHKHISIATGMNVGITVNDDRKDSFIKVVERMYVKNNKKDNGNHSKNKTFKNECRENLYSYLKSKDDTLILLVSLIINTIHKKNISQELLSKAKLFKADSIPKSDFDTNKILNEIFSFDYSDSTNQNNNKINNSNALITESNSITKYSINETEGNIEDRNSKSDTLLLNDTKYASNNNIATSNSNNSFPFDAPDLDDENQNNLNPSMIKLDKINIVVDSQQVRKSIQENEKLMLLDNSYFSNIFSKDTKNFLQKPYDPDLVDTLLNLLMVEPPFRTITNRIILENISSLIVKVGGFSFIDRNQLDIINKTYYSYLSNIKLIILQNKYIRETGFELFENEWRNYKVEISNIIEELIARPFLLVPFNLEDMIEDYPKILKLQKTEVDNFRSYLIIFMTLHDLRNKIYRDGDIIKNNFPLKLGGYELEMEKTYNLSNMGLEMYQCKLKFSNGKNFIYYILVIYQNHLYFAQKDLKDSNLVAIKYKFALRHLEAQFDRSDPRILNLIVKDKNNYIDIALYFEDVNKTSSIKKNLEEQRKSSRNTEYLLLDSYFDELINKWKF